MQTFTGIEYLKIDIANNFGLDKSTYQERIDWFNTNISFSPESSSTDIIEWIHINQPKEPELFFAGVQAYIKYLNNEPSGYMISFDASLNPRLVGRVFRLQPVKNSFCFQSFKRCILDSKFFNHQKHCLTKS